MDHGSHGGGGGGGTTGGFRATNTALALSFWYLVVAFVGLLVLVRISNYFQARARIRACSNASLTFPTRPTNRAAQAWATATAIGREMSYPQLYVPVRLLSFLTPPPLGRVLVLLAYWAVIIYMMAADAIIKDPYFWERLGFRNAWVTLMQLPLLFLLAGKANVLGYLVGTSHERLNWLHRWVGRTMLVTGAVHGFQFYRQWVIADFVQDQLEMMPMVKYGFGAWGLLLWACFSSFAPLRQAWYELFVAQHILTAAFLLWTIYVHIPVYAQWYLWFAIAALCFDRSCRLALLVWQNVKFRPKRARCDGGQRIGHMAQLRAVGNDITVVTIKDVHFRWVAGQHLYLWLPRVGPLESHPYTIACAHRLPDTCICNSIQLVVRKHNGFSKRLHAHAMRAQERGGKKTFTAFVSGPYGAPPRWDIYETLVLISASTGASFTLPILESVLRTKKKMCTKRVDVLVAARRGDQIDYYVQRLHEFIERAKDVGIELRVHIAVTREPPVEPQPSLYGDHQHGPASEDVEGIQLQEKKAASSAVPDVEVAAADTIAPSSSGSRPRTAGSSKSEDSTDSHVHSSASRPDVAHFIRGPVEAAGGETSVVVCGGKSLVATVRNCVAALSDERAVHKGSGAQGIHLHVEEYSF